MTVLLDTNICIAYLNGTNSTIRERLLSLTPDQVRLCSVVKAELLYGARHSTRVAQNLKRLAHFFEPFESLPFDDNAADWYGILRAQLQKDGQPIGGNDMMIAAIARSHDVTLITRNEDEFRRVAGLRVETWMAPEE